MFKDLGHSTMTLGARILRKSLQADDQFANLTPLPDILNRLLCFLEWIDGVDNIPKWQLRRSQSGAEIVHIIFRPSVNSPVPRRAVS